MILPQCPYEAPDGYRWILEPDGSGWHLEREAE